ncbi:MAG: acetate--CoA ligase family protein [Haloferacaceae archaeon]
MSRDVPDLDPLLDPESVAVVGASPDSWYASNLIDNLLEFGFEGALHLVNPGRDEAWGRPCHDSIADVPEVVDLAVVSVPREHVVGVVEAAGRRGVPAALVIAAGFAEADEEGAALERDLAAAAAEHGVRVCGPNCIGLLNGRAGTVLTSTCTRAPDSGRIALLSQSGALAFTTFYERATDEDTDFAYVVSTGNEADLTMADYVAYAAADPAVDVVCAYVEGLDDPRRFVAAAREATRSGTPVLTVKIGRSEVASAAAASHTGAVVGSDAVWDGALRQAGVERVPDVPDLIGRASAHAAFDPPASDRVCVASTSGGLATLLADLADERGLSLPALSEDTEAALLDMDELLTFGELHNPADVRGYGADVLPEIAGHLFADDRFDAYLFAVGLSAVNDRAAAIADDLIEVVERAEDPVVLLWTGRREPADRDDPQPYERLRRAAPLFYDPADAVDALASLVDARAARARLDATPTVTPGTPAGTVPDRDGVLPWRAATDLLAAYGVEPVETRLAADADGAVAAAEAIGFPVVAKVDAPAVPHRGRVGAVRTDLGDADAVRAGHDAVRTAARTAAPDAGIEGVLVQRQVDAGVEALVGATRDPEFGPVVTVGAGGRAVEALDDTAHLLAPAAPAAVRTALDRTSLPARAAAAGVDDALDDLAAVAARVSELVAEHDRVAELDLNPVGLTDRGTAVVDALVRVVGTRDGDQQN